MLLQQLKSNNGKSILPTSRISILQDENASLPTKQSLKRTNSGKLRNALGDITNVAQEKPLGRKKEALANLSSVFGPPTKKFAGNDRVPINTTQQSSLLSSFISFQKPQTNPLSNISSFNFAPIQETLKPIRESEHLSDSENQKLVSDLMELDLSEEEDLIEISPQEEDIEQDIIEDIDFNDRRDPLFCSEYVNDILMHWKKKELKDAINYRYFERQNELTEKHRRILVDWLAEVCISLELLSDTLFLAVNLVDKYLERRVVPKKHFQLLGITCLMIAAKYEEIIAPSASCFEYMTDQACKKATILAMENKILVCLNFNLTTPSPLQFLRRYSKAAKYDSRLHSLAKYLAELSMLEVAILKFVPSKIAASCVYLAKRMTSTKPFWNKMLQHYTGFSLEDLKECIVELNNLRLKQSKSKFQVITQKYSSFQLFSVAHICAIPNLTVMNI